MNMDLYVMKRHAFFSECCILLFFCWLFNMTDKRLVFCLGIGYCWFRGLCCLREAWHWLKRWRFNAIHWEAGSWAVGTSGEFFKASLLKTPQLASILFHVYILITLITTSHTSNFRILDQLVIFFQQQSGLRIEIINPTWNWSCINV